MKFAYVLLPLVWLVGGLNAHDLAARDGPSPADERKDPSSAPAPIERGRASYMAMCASCHGADALGGRGPDLIRATSVRHDKEGDLIGPIVSNGRPDRGMPALPLSHAQIAELAAFLRAQIALFDMHTRSPGGYPDDIPASRLATGSVEAGKAYFYGAGGCARCHSPTGDLAGIASRYTAPDLQSRFLYPAGKPATATVTLSAGVGFRGTLLRIDEFEVAIRDADGWYRSWPRHGVTVQVDDPLTAHGALAYRYSDADMHNLLTFLETLK